MTPRSRTGRAALLLVTLLTALALIAPAEAASPSRVGQVGRSAQPTAKKHHEKRHCANGKPSHRYRDKRHDSAPGIDIATLSVWGKRSDRCDQTLITGDFSRKHAQAIQAYYDTKTGKKHRGWEYQAFAYSKVDGDQRKGGYLYRKTSHGVVRVHCDVYSSFEPGRHRISMSVPQSCLGKPKHVKVLVQLYDITTYRSHNRWRGYADNAPKKGYTGRF